MKNKKAIIYSIIMLLFIVGLITFKFNNKTSSSLVENIEKNASVLNDSSLGNWTMTNEWVNLNSKSNVVINKDVAVINATQNIVEENEITYRINLSYEGGTAQSNFGNEYNEEGIILYFYNNMFPFATREDISEYVWTADPENNRIVVEKNIGGYHLLFAYIYFNGLVNENSRTDQQFAWRLITDYSPAEIDIYNAEEISAADNLDTTFDITFQILPSFIYDNTDIADSFFPKVYMHNEHGSIDSFPEDTSNSFHANVNGKLAIENIVKSEPEIFEEWNNNWGTNPDSGNNYFYVLYSVDGSINSTKPFNTDPNISSTLIPTIPTGELVVYSDGTTYKVGDITDYASDNEFSEPFDDFNDSTFKKLSNEIPTVTDFTRTYVVKYPKPSSGEVTTNFSLSIEATGDGDFNTIKKNVSWTAKYTASGGGSVTPTYPSGENNSITVEYEDTTNGIGAVNVIDKNDIDFSLFIEPTSAEMNKNSSDERLKAFNNWNITNTGANSYNLEVATTKTVLDSSYNSINSENVLTKSEYNIISISPSIIKYDYTLSNDRYYLTENNNDASGNLKVSAEINGTWTEIGSLSIEGNSLNYIANNANTTNVYGITNDNPIILPANTTNIKINYNGTKAAIYIGTRVNLKLLSAAKTKINNIYNANNSVVLRQYANTKVNNNTKDTKYKDVNLTKLDSNSSMTYTSTKTKNTNSYTINYESKVTEDIEYNSSVSNIAINSIKKQQNAKYYILLPQGALLVDNSVIVKDINDNVINASISIGDEYQNTNRKLVTVTISNTDNNTKVINNKLVSGYVINYQVDYPHTSNRDYGNTIYSDIAYYSENKITNGYNNAANANSNLFSSNSIKTAFSNLGTAESSYLFKTNTITVDPVATSLGTLKTSVKNTIDNEHKENTTVKIGNTYQYKIEYSYSDPLTEMTNLVIYSSLENAYGNNSYWQGTLSSIDTSSLQSIGLDYTIYYSYNSNLDLSNNRNLDLTRSDTWSSDTPNNMANVKAIAIDCSSNNITGVKIPIVYLNMISTLNRNDINKNAYNNSLIKFDTLGETKTISSNTSIVKLEDANISLDVTPKESINGTVYDKGTENAYASINETLGYLYHITNNDEVNYNNVNITSKISNNLTINDNQILYYTDINDIHNLDSSIVYSNNNNSIDLKINNLSANTNLYIYVPVSIDSNITEDNSKYTTVSSINKLSDKAFNSSGIKTYNRANIPSIIATHTTKTIYNNNIFSSEDTYVNKGETITNMIKITNDGDSEVRNTKIIETLPSGVTVDDSTITNGGVHSDNKITWDITSILSTNSLELTYNMTIPNNPNNNTYFTTSTKLEVLNPLDNTKKIIDKELEYGTVVYRNITDLKITNTINGALANKNKEFKYTLEINAPSYAAGTYNPTYTSNGETKEASKLTIGADGKATYNFSIIGEGELLINSIPGGYTIKITEQAYEGYSTSINNNSIVGRVIEDTIDENTNEHLRTYAFLNEYSATGTFTPIVKTNYDKELIANMFEVEMKTGDVTNTAQNNADGDVAFNTITFANEVGTYNYTFSEKRGTNERILYDSTVYNVYVKVTDDGKGKLKAEVNIYDSTGAKHDSIVFDNKFIKVGLLIKNNNTGDYINTNKSFNYKVAVEGVTPNTSYKISNQNNEEIEQLAIDDNGEGIYEFSLKHGEFIVIEELPIGSTYVVEEQLEKYYTSTIDNIESTADDNILRTTGTIILATTQIIYNNNYQTEANFAPKANIILKDKELENNEFVFLITDTSDGITNGYSDIARNDADGNIYFNNIKFTRPGTYTYEIQQLSSENPNIIIDNNKLLLTLILEDNEDGTMSITSNYKYLNGSANFINVYSEFLPIIDGESAHNLNPNTMDRTLYPLIISIMTVIFIIIGRIIRIRKFNKI